MHVSCVRVCVCVCVCVVGACGIGDPVLLRKWGIQQLPKDDFSLDNAVILTRSMRVGLMIDPQEQANRWSADIYIVQICTHCMIMDVVM
ncbi:MAG TPA: hypothetical protein V6C97_24470 [Oculatellaceae cyanobacterium]